jgi:hypothetical protein
MDISYTLYYVLMDELRTIISSIYSRRMITKWTYEYTDLEHVEDVDKRHRYGLPTNVIARIEYCYSEFSIFWNVHEIVNHVWLTSDGCYRIEIPDEILDAAMKKWLLLVFDKYNARNS